EKQLKEFGDKIPAEKKSAIESALTQLKAVHGQRDLTGIDAAMETLNAAWEAASKEMYAASQEQGGAGTPPPGAESNTNPADSVTDVDFEEVKQ
ncbi:MAG: molecular chaperone DnaK, partial [Bacteroidota bacterium]